MDIRLGESSDYTVCTEIGNFFSESVPTKKIFSELIKNNQLYVADVEGKIVGHISYKTLWNESVMIQFLRIHPDFHRKGIGSQLIKHIEKTTKENGVYEVFSTVLADNTPSKKLHKKLGYSEAGFIDFDSGKEIVFLKVL